MQIIVTIDWVVEWLDRFESKSVVRTIVQTCTSLYYRCWMGHTSTIYHRNTTFSRKNSFQNYLGFEYQSEFLIAICILNEHTLIQGQTLLDMRKNTLTILRDKVITISTIKQMVILDVEVEGWRETSRTWVITPPDISTKTTTMNCHNVITKSMQVTKNKHEAKKKHWKLSWRRHFLDWTKTTCNETIHMAPVVTTTTSSLSQTNLLAQIV